MKALYKYPQSAFPYGRLVEENRRRDRRTLEFELIDTGVFDEHRYFDVACRVRQGVRRLLSIVTREQLPRVLAYMLDEKEFLSPQPSNGLDRPRGQAPATKRRITMGGSRRPPFPRDDASIRRERVSQGCHERRGVADG
jgi:hypothetical protein